MDKIFNLTYASSLTDLCEVNSSFDTGILRICYSGENQNKSFISKETLMNGIKSIYCCPIVCNYDRTTDTLGGHDIEVVCDDDGDMRIVNATTPIGVIPESARTWFQEFEEEDGTVHEYLCAEVLLWKRQEAYRKIKKDGITAHSMEIKSKDGKLIDGLYHITDFEFTAFTLIGVTPCFEGSALEVFEKNDFKQRMSEMMQDLKDTFAKVNTSNEVDNIHPQNYSMEGGEKALEDKMNLVAKYGIDIDTLDFSIEDFTVEELTEKFEAMKNAEKGAEPDSKTGYFALTQNIVDEIKRKLTVEKIEDECWGPYPRYCYVDCDIEAGEVYCWDESDWLLYGFAFSVDGDCVTIDFDSKKRKKFVIADFEGEEQLSPIAQVLDAVNSKLKGGKEAEEKLDAALEQIASMEVELSELRQFKSEADEATAVAEREAVFAQFEDLAGIDAFEALKGSCSEYDTEALEEKCFALRGRFGTSLKFSAKEPSGVPKIKIIKTEITNEPYGGLVERYVNKGSN